MAEYAVIQNNLVVNVIVADSKEIAESVTDLECVDIAEEIGVGIGWSFTDNVFTKPEQEIIPPTV